MNFDREDLLSLIDSLLAGRFRGGFVVASSPDRIARFGYRMVERIAEKCGAKIVYLLERPEEGADSLTDEILAILTHYTARASGRKAKAICEKTLPEETLRLAYRMQRQGASIREIYGRLDAIGKACDTKGRRLSYKTIWRRLTENRDVLAKALPEESKQENSFSAFARDCLKRKPDGKLARSVLFDHYRHYCRERGLPTVTPQALMQAMKAFGASPDRSSGRTAFAGVALKC